MKWTNQEKQEVCIIDLNWPWTLKPGIHTVCRRSAKKTNQTECFGHNDSDTMLDIVCEVGYLWKRRIRKQIRLSFLPTLTPCWTVSVFGSTLVANSKKITGKESPQIYSKPHRRLLLLLWNYGGYMDTTVYVQKSADI